MIKNCLFAKFGLISLLLLFHLFTLKAQNPYKLENLGKEVNSKYDEIVPLITPDGKKIYYVRVNHPKNISGVKESEDIWESNLKEDGLWTPAKHLDKPVNIEGYNGLYGVSPDGNTLIIRGAYENGVKVGRGYSFIRKTKTGWSQPQKLNIEMYDEYDLGMVQGGMLSNDGKTLLMYLSRSYKSAVTDIFVSFLKDDSTWTRPFNLGPGINTKYTECTPFLASDGVTLYFGSDRDGGLGGSDIYMSKRLDTTWQKWSKPRNLGFPINTPDWEGYYSIDAEGKYAYLVTSRNTYGAGDIARIQLLEDIQPNPVIIVYGTVYNSKTLQPISANLVYEFLPQGIEAGRATSNVENGSYKIILPCGKNYGFSAKAKGFIGISDNMDLTNVLQYQEIKRDLYLVPIEVGQTVRLNNIFFESGKATLTNASYPELDRLVKVLNENAEMEIEISGHTDNVGAAEFNLKLSMDRSKAVTTYLVGKQISEKRIITKGYGESKPVSSNDNEEGRQKNRRVEFTIIKK